MTDQTTISNETNKRFWLTGYKPGQKLNMALAEDRDQSKKWLEINRQVKAEDAAHALVLTPDHPPSDPAILVKETNARFWAQHHWKINQKLDMSNLQDKAMSKKWLDINRIVKAEDAAGRLTVTYNDPVVVQALAHAQAAEQAATSHTDAAAKEPDPKAAKQMVDAAMDFLGISVKKGEEAAAAQPTSVPPHTVKLPVPKAPPKSAPASDQVAHVKTIHAFSKAVRNMLIKETNALFWVQTNYRPGRLLRPSNATDRTKMLIWMDIFSKVQRQYADGTLKTTYDDPVVAQHIADAIVADQATPALLDTAAATTDLETKQQALAAAAVAQEIKAQKLREAAARQRPTASPRLLKEATEAAKDLPPPSPDASTSDQIAHEQAKDAANEAAGAKDSKPQGGGLPDERTSTTAKVAIVGGLLVVAGLVTKYVRMQSGATREIAGIEERNPVRPRAARAPRASRDDTAVVRALPFPTMAVR